MTVKVTHSVLVLLIVASGCWAHQPKQSILKAKANDWKGPSLFQAEPNHIEFNTSIMKCTFKLSGKGSVGTAFVILKSYPPNTNMGFPVLITAAHVLDQIEGEEATLYLRKKEGEDYVKQPLKIKIRKDGKPLWTKHPKADLAVMFILMPQGTDIALYTTSVLATEQSLQQMELHPGDELVCLGYPYEFEANEYGFPILRSGKIASYPILPAERVRAFLYDFNVFSGNSGGPVYIAQATRTTSQAMQQFGPFYSIVGMVSEQIYMKSNSEPIGVTKQKRESLALAVVIHAQLIKEAIDLLPAQPRFGQR